MALYRHFETQGELDAEYDVGGSVPDFGDIAAFYENTSARARQEMRCQLDVPYGPTRPSISISFLPSGLMHPF